MLKQRLLTAAILIPLVVWAIFASSLTSFTGLIVAVALIAGWEWYEVLGIKSPALRVILMIDLLAVFYLALTQVNPHFTISIGILLWTLAALVILGFASKTGAAYLTSLFRNKIFGIIISVLVLTIFVVSSVTIKAMGAPGAFLFLFALVTVWLADTGGYFAGKQFGKHSLASSISPNKTWEGVAGGVAFASIWAVGFYLIAEPSNMSLVSWFFISLLTVLAAIVGDLFESLFKRAYDVKDSGHLLPGHGGMLDRVDSLLAAIPVFAFIVLLMSSLA
ncbi:hypothetical protein LCGC14_0778540 [marine sediment metagenome]|uniref:Phosphatidate cytidylyltransferase n=1 Tax=marine sediment metagenome TaxID=412755 RepID=A0A0F9Q0E8_9ZZZZ